MSDQDVQRERSRERDYSHPPTEPTAALALSAYAGKYANDYFGPIELVERDGQLVLRLGPKPLEFSLQHWDRDTFIYQPTGEMAGGPSGVCFSVAPDVHADRVLVENLDANGQGAFSRAK